MTPSPNGSHPLPAPFPDGWFRVARSTEVPARAVRPLRYFGRDLVLFRGEDGRARVLDAHCPHLGAHLGHGGTVEGDALRCPFHGWLIGGDGACVQIPYARTVPPRARIGTWPVREVNGLVMVYYHARGKPPAWELPALPELTMPGWTPLRPGHRWRIRAHIQDVAENGVDTAHMPLVHRGQTEAIASEALETDGPVLVHHMAHQYRLFPLARWLGARVAGPLEITYYGLGVAVNRARVQAGLTLSYLFLFTFTPVDEHEVEVDSLLSMQRVVNPLVTWALGAKALREGRKTIDQDVPIFEHKIHRPEPPLVEGDGPVMQYRRWARQFYSATAEALRP
jgi:phenylpropionate dioxygenase-like ring-hydroxylating dioxygenase large terminal subunit